MRYSKSVSRQLYRVTPHVLLWRAVLALATIIGLGPNVVHADDEVFVLNSAGNSVTVYQRAAAGNTSPLRTISGAATGLSFPRGLGIDTANAEIIVGDSDTIFVYPLTATGNVAPLRTLHLASSSRIVNLAIDAVNNELIVVDQTGSIQVFGRTATGNTPPVRKIEGPMTGIGFPAGFPVGVALDVTHNEIVITRAGAQSDAVLVYSRTADGNVAPLRSITGAATGLLTPVAVAVDTTNDELVVLDEAGGTFNAITVYGRTAAGNIAPARKINGAATAMLNPISLALDAVNNDIYVANSGNNTVTVYPRAGTGNVAPTRTLGGDATGLAAPDTIVLPQPAAPPPPPTAVVAAVLPNVRAVQTGTLVTVNATIINAGAAPAVQTGIALATPAATTFNYQQLDTSVSPPLLVGSPGTPVDIPPGGQANFVLFLTPSAPFDPTELTFTFAGVNTPPAPTFLGVNTLLLLSSATPTADVVALAATSPNDGIVRIPGTNGTGVFAVATTNLGIGDTITVTADTGAFPVGVTVTICQTNAATGACLAPPAPSVNTFVAAGAQPTFGFFVTGTGVAIPLDPAVSRVFARFRRPDGRTVGGTSVAVETL